MSDAQKNDLIAEKVNITVTIWPHSWSQVTGMGVLCLAVVTSIYIFMVLADKEARSLVLQTVTSYIGTPSGAVTKSEDYYIIGFWTPDELTQADLELTYKGNVPAIYLWQLESHSTNKVVRFGKQLVERFEGKMMGFRHYQITGLGKSGDVKRGRWWSLTLAKQVDPEEVVAFYKQFWSPKSQFYMEVVGRALYVKP